MKRLLPVLLLIAVAISGCTEKGPETPEKSTDELKTLSIAAAENLSSFAAKASMIQTLKLYSKDDSNITIKTDSTETSSSVDLSRQKVHATGSTKTQVQFAGQDVGNTSIDVEIYLIGNTTYQSDGRGNWTRLVDPRSGDDIWGGGSNNQVKGMAGIFNLTKAEILGSESVDSEEAYKIKFVAGSEDLVGLYRTAYNIVGSSIPPYLLPSINQTELNETEKMEKTIWISKKSFLPVKYQDSISFSMTPQIVGVLNMTTGQVDMLPQSVEMGKIDVDIQSNIKYFDFDSPVEIAPPAEALSAPAQLPGAVQI